MGVQLSSFANGRRLKIIIVKYHVISYIRGIITQFKAKTRYITIYVDRVI